MTDFNHSVQWLGRACTLRDLVAEARYERRRRFHARFPSAPAVADVTEVVARQRRATLLTERMLSIRLPRQVDFARYLEVMVGRQQMASDVLATLTTHVEKVTLFAFRARALAVALTELLHFAEVGVAPGGLIRAYLAVAIDDDRLVIGLGFDGDVQPLATESATRALLRASAIVGLLRGEFQRGVDNGRMVFGMTFPCETAVCGWA